MTGVEIDFVVKDSIRALEQYESIFEVERIEVTDYECGRNEAVFAIYGTRFHMLDENPQYMLIAPNPEDPKTMWMNIIVPDIQETYEKAMKAGCTVIQPPTHLEEMGVTNAMFSDSFGYIWMIHQIHKAVSFEDRCKVMEGSQI